MNPADDRPVTSSDPYVILLYGPLDTGNATACRPSHGFALGQARERELQNSVLPNVMETGDIRRLCEAKLHGRSHEVYWST
jgi:hypothetical protein